LKEYEFSTKLNRENQFDFRNLPCAISQQVIAQVFSSIKGWMKGVKEFEKNHSKFHSKSKLPKYKSGKKQNMIVFTTNACRIRNNHIYFAKNIIQPIKTNVKKEELKQVRIVPQATSYVVEVIYERKEENLDLQKDNFLSIDLGLNNLCTCTNNVNQRFFIVNGKVVKSFNQWFNKTKAKRMSFVGDKGISKRLKRLICYRNLWINDKIHKISRFIIDFCKKNNIGTIVIGLNKNWKQNINLGKKNNQKFVEIPFSNLVDKISYKAKLVGIDVKITEESYTSKVDHLAFESLEKHDIYSGKRKKRGLFQSSVNQLINADINGSIGIARKVFGDSAVQQIIGSGLAFNPIRVNIL
jgi:putative transposase